MTYADQTPNDRGKAPSYILIVDDDPAICEVLASYLRPKGYRIRSVMSGRMALAEIGRDVPDVVILDLRLSDISGLEVQHRIREAGVETEIIIITCFASLDSALDAIKHGAFDYIVKPFKLGEIEISVRNALERLDLRKRNRFLEGRVHELTERLLSVRSAPSLAPTIRFDEQVVSRNIGEARTRPIGYYREGGERKAKPAL
jgi:DNA-binding NtrC family response regulator